MLDSTAVPEPASRNARRSGPIFSTVTDTLLDLNVGRTKFYQLVAAGEIEIVKIGAATRVVNASVDAYVERLRAKAKSAGRRTASAHT